MSFFDKINNYIAVSDENKLPVYVSRTIFMSLPACGRKRHGPIAIDMCRLSLRLRRPVPQNKVAGKKISGERNSRWKNTPDGQRAISDCILSLPGVEGEY